MPAQSRVVLVSAVLLGVAAIGCERVDPAVKRSLRASAVLAGTRQSMVQAERVVANSQASLRTLQEAKGDLTPAFEAFAAQLALVRKQADHLRGEGETVKAEAHAYCTARHADVGTITNGEMRNLAKQRADHVRQEYNVINDGYARVNAGFVQYIRSLNDLQRFLANELNYGAVRSGEKWCAEALAAGESLRGDIRSLALKIDLTSNLLSPSPTAVTRFPSTLKTTATAPASVPEHDRPAQEVP
jgi:hypothetical protein